MLAVAAQIPVPGTYWDTSYKGLKLPQKKPLSRIHLVMPSIVRRPAKPLACSLAAGDANVIPTISLASSPSFLPIQLGSFSLLKPQPGGALFLTTPTHMAPLLTDGHLTPCSYANSHFFPCDNMAEELESASVSSDSMEGYLSP